MFPISMLRHCIAETCTYQPPCGTQCTNCRSAGKRCDSGRPCLRCVKKGLEDSCKDAPNRRRKPVRGSQQRGAEPTPSVEHPQMAGTSGSAEPTAHQSESLIYFLSRRPRTCGVLAESNSHYFACTQVTRPRQLGQAPLTRILRCMPQAPTSQVPPTRVL